MFKINQIFLKKFALNVRFRRCKHKDNHWAVERKKKTSTDRALEHFDEFYEETFKRQWQDIRKGLLGKQKYVAIINNYSDSDAAMKFLENKGALNLRTIFDLEKGHLHEEHAKIKRQKDLERVWKSEKSDPVAEQQTTEKPNFSLHKSLENAEYDMTRIIDGSNPTCILYEFVPATKLKGREDFIPEHSVLTQPDTTDDNETYRETVKEYSLHFPEYLNIYCFEEENQNDFPQPRRGSTQVLNYYLMDGGSVLPVLALDLKPGSRFLDMCAAPGGKSIIALQTLYPDFVTCNDISPSRINRIFRVMKQYLYDFEERWLTPGKIEIKQQDARVLNADGFDRVLVDVPCTTDRHSVKEDDNNIFRVDRIKERLQLPELQTELLMNALKVVQPGGIVVYSTCSLSPIQNEGVVHMAIKRIEEETSIEVEIKDLSPALMQFRNVFKFRRPIKSKYGHLVLPISAQNYGPTYFCKLQRLK